MKFYVDINNNIYAYDDVCSLDFVFDSVNHKWKVLPFSLNFLQDNIGIEISEIEASYKTDIQALKQLIDKILNI